ncbi:flagellar hook-length control protein FliK [Ruegeria sp. HKCCA6837]|uniref:flagellar hook-length control protein FliK n=1 Tax=Ruegeria sp. HKCCA6837 TaxID=2682989 RepID=UPI0014879540|nr:flagellar hook-length control protein FliK [Ruegeria sp. HKCCA6837]
MPNSIMLATTASIAPAKPTSSQNEMGQASGVTRFEDILGQDGKTDDLPDTDLSLAAPEIETPDAEAQSIDMAEPEAAPLLEPLRVVELVSSSTHVAYSQPVAEGGLSSNTLASAGDPSASAENDPERPKFSSTTSQPDPVDAPAPALTRSKTGQVLPALNQHVTPVAVAKESRPIDHLTKAKGTFNAPESAPTSQSIESTQRSEVTPATIKSTKPAHAPPVAQLQMLVDLIEKEHAVLDQSAETTVVTKDEALQTAPRETTQHLSGQSTFARAEIARAIAGQLAASIQGRAGSGAMEIALNPEELGRVSIVLNGRDDGMHMTIATERPETLELMRRHLSVLAEEFQKLGYGELNFDLGTSSDADGQAVGTDTPESGSAFDDPQSDSDAQIVSLQQIQVPGRGIDMRF